MYQVWWGHPIGGIYQVWWGYPIGVSIKFGGDTKLGRREHRDCIEHIYTYPLHDA